MLQQSRLPHRILGTTNPDAPMPASCCEQANAGAMPFEAFQYSIAYDAFRADKDFWRQWKVVDCARNSPDQSIRHGSATIRVVLDLSPLQRLFPTAYTPGFPTLPFGTSPGETVGAGRVTWVVEDGLPKDEGEDLTCLDHVTRLEDMKRWCQENPAAMGFAYDQSTGSWRPKKFDSGLDTRPEQWQARSRANPWKLYYIKERAEARRRLVKTIAGLPAGYSVALEVHILDEARIMLAHQRSFRNGKINPEFEWLDAIMHKVDGDGAKPQPRAKRSSRPKMLANDHLRPEAELRPPVGSVPLDGGEQGKSEDVKAYSDLYGDASQVVKHVTQGKNQVYAENTLISAFGSDVRLPKPESGSWSGPVPKSAAERQRELQEGRELDRELDGILERTGGKSGGGMLAGRLDR